MINPLCSFVASTNISDIYHDWSCTANGNPTTNPCGTDNSTAWSGVKCQIDQVVDIELRLQSLEGTLSDNFGNLFTLTKLTISGSKIYGEIPSSFGQFSELQGLFLNSNQLSKSLPSELGYLSQLQTLSLYENWFSSALPTTLGSLSSLQFFEANYNFLSHSLPNNLLSLSKLEYLSLSNNCLTGSLPSTIWQLSNLWGFYVNKNRMTGVIPESFGKLTTMSELYLHSNHFNGSIPASFGNMSNVLEMFIFGNSFTNTIPETFAHFSRLITLYLYGNLFSGSFPTSLCSLPSLVELYINNNGFSHSLPPCIGNMSSLHTLWAGDNFFTGALPSSMSRLSRCHELVFFDNRLEGSIPEIFENMSFLTELYLYGNSLTGPMPLSLSALSVLEQMDLSSNSLSATIPSFFGDLKLLNVLDVSDNAAITGSIPATLCQFHNVHDTNLSTQGLQVNVQGTGIQCYSGCLTSVAVDILGASDVCPDGSITQLFAALCAAVGGVGLLCSLWQWNKRRQREHSEMSQSLTDTQASDLIGEDWSATLYRFCRRRTLLLNVIKLGFVLLVSLVINDYWRHCGASSSTSSVSSCSSSDTGSCKSFCNDVSLTTFDILIETIDPTTELFTTETLTTGYCTATLSDSCSCQYWKIFILGPMMLHLTYFLIQCVWYVGFSGIDPLRYQYETMSRCWEGNIDYSVLVTRLSSTYPWSNALALIELSGIAYAWLSIVYAPLRCDLSVPLSFFYYPILMTILDCSKLNIYRAIQVITSAKSRNGILLAIGCVFSVDVMIWYFGILFLQLWILMRYIFMILTGSARSDGQRRGDSWGTKERDTMEFHTRTTEKEPVNAVQF